MHLRVRILYKPACLKSLVHDKFVYCDLKIVIIPQIIQGYSKLNVEFLGEVANTKTNNKQNHIEMYDQKLISYRIDEDAEMTSQ